MSGAKKRKLIGWREWVSLPDLGVSAIKVKVDSGARTSALHATKIRYLTMQDGQIWVSFRINTDTGNVKVKAPLLEKRRIKSSMGHASVRPVIVTMLQLGTERWP